MLDILEPGSLAISFNGGKVHAERDHALDPRTCSTCLVKTSNPSLEFTVSALSTSLHWRALDPPLTPTSSLIQDAVAMMHIVKEACDQHRTHKWTHVQPIWFKNPTDEFPELINFVQEQAKVYFMHQVMHFCCCHRAPLCLTLLSAWCRVGSAP